MKNIIKQLKKNGISANKKAKSFAKTVKSTLDLKLSKMENEVMLMEDELEGLLDINIGTDVNSGKIASTREEVTEAYSSYVDLEVKLELKRAKLKVMQKSVSNLLGDE